MDKVCVDLVPEGEIIGPQHIRNLFFGNYIEPDAEPKIYDEVSLDHSFQNHGPHLTSLADLFFSFIEIVLNGDRQK